MLPVPLVTSSECFSVPLFWEIVQLYHNRPFLANKLITAVTNVLFHRVECSGGAFKHVAELFTNSAVLYERRKLKDLSNECITVYFIRNIIEPYSKNIRITQSNEEEFNSAQNGTYISIQLLMSRKNTDHQILHVAILDKGSDSAVFVGAYEMADEKLTPVFPYEFQLSGKTFKINLQNFEDADSRNAEWLADVLFPKLLKWSQHEPKGQNNIKTLTLVPLDEYSILYNRLKKTYVEGLLKNWLEKTNTDPQKYIFEDLAIASYLICIWKKYPKTEINFVDCGCGNGLLVYILNQEGYGGYGIDIRKRAIWDAYPKETQLEVGTVTPNSTFTGCTWLIGNHSDELTPWIPIMALKTSPKTNFFVLPCCPYEFNGEKYIRSNSSISTYSDYLLYVEDICKKCGFETKLDKLRIPSTKKVCLVGINTCADEDQSKEMLEKVQPLVESKMRTEFKPRGNVEVVRNCTQLNRELTDKLIHMCVGVLLEEQNLIEKPNGQFWNKGSTISMLEISQKLPQTDLKELRKQCGGLQTLFRNFRYIFEVNKGSVALRRPTTYAVTKEKYRKKPCWFQKNHPDGCFNLAEDCSYFHS